MQDNDNKEQDKTIPEWALVVWKLKAEFDAIEYRISKLEEAWTRK